MALLMKLSMQIMLAIFSRGIYDQILIKIFDDFVAQNRNIILILNLLKTKSTLTDNTGLTGTVNPANTTFVLITDNASPDTK